MADPTAGPWELAWEDGRYGVIAAATGKKLICVIGNNPDDGLNDIRRANAELMAQAPTMRDRINELSEDYLLLNAAYMRLEVENADLREKLEEARKWLPESALESQDE